MDSVIHAGEVAGIRRSLIRFAISALRPLIRVLLRYGLSYPELNQICRWLYVDIAMREREFFLPKRKRQFKARVACCSGLSRKEVLRLYSCPPPEENPEISNFNRAARVLEGWLNDDHYQDATGKPKTLPFRDEAGKPSFSELVRAHSGDIPPRAILDELVRAGTCGVDEQDQIMVLRPFYIARVPDMTRLSAAADQLASIMAEIDQQLLPTDTTRRPKAVPDERVRATA